MGRRGEGWFLLQMILFAVILVAPNPALSFLYGCKESDPAASRRRPIRHMGHGCAWPQPDAFPKPVRAVRS